MKKINTLFSFIFLASGIFAQLPNTDIWLLDIQTAKDSLIFSNPVNITNRSGYDNQPAFSPDGKYILYTSIRDEKQSDIFKYDLKTKTTTQFTNTTTSEYSPTFMPDGKNISVVMVEPDSAQRLWKFPIKGGASSLIMDKVDSIGYHCWITKDSLALIMITNPPTLDVVNIHSQKPRLLASNVSRCMVKLYQDEFAFEYINKDTTGTIESASEIKNPKNCKIGPTHVLFKFQDFAMFQATNGCSYVVIGWNSKLYMEDIFKSKTTICDLSKYGLSNITRIAISANGKKIAIVSESK